MSTLWPQDIRAAVITRMQDGIYGINAQLTAIDTKRGTTTAQPLQYDPVIDNGQFPSVFVDLGDADIPPIRGMKAKSIQAIMDLHITVLLKDSNYTQIKQHGENYIEAIEECLQDYGIMDSTGMFYMVAFKEIRADLDTQEGQTIRGIGVIFKVHRNKY